MKVILKDTGKVQEVPDGYARNYLIPKGLAVVATTEELNKIEVALEKRSEEEEKKRAEVMFSAKKIEGKIITLSEKAGEYGKLFGGVTTKEIAEAIHLQQKFIIDKHNIELKTPIKLLGSYEMKVNFGMGVSAKFTLVVSSS